jgi:hypothetical protein
VWARVRRKEDAGEGLSGIRSRERERERERADALGV